MTGRDEIYRINEPKVVGETLDGETIVINLETGRYYSMNSSGSVIWELMRSGLSVCRIVESASSRFDADEATVGQAVQDFLDLLKRSNLIALSHTSETRAAAWAGPKEPFDIPAVEEFNDMQEMLLADPIHDVSSAGWPHRK